jgi:hypothetical protein
MEGADGVQAGVYGGCRLGTGRGVWRVQTGYRDEYKARAAGTGARGGLQGRAEHDEQLFNFIYG